MMMDDKKKPGL